MVFIFGIILCLLNLLILFYFSPIFLLITEIISPFLLWIVTTIEKKIQGKTNEKLELVLCPVGYFIVLFSSLICNEIIILNCCGLSKNTKIFVNKRMNSEISRVNKFLQG